MSNLRGLEEKHEKKSQHLIRDTRTFMQRVIDFFRDAQGVSVFLAILALLCFMIPAFSDFILMGAITAFIWCRSFQASLPFRLPASSQLLDYNDPKPGSNKPRKAQGLAFFGNAIGSNQELWFSNTDMSTHVLIFGSTGSGKTQGLLSVSYNALIHGSGFIYIDGKGDNLLYAQIFSMCRSMGREDDLLLINFMTGAKDIVGAQKDKITNTMNPFAVGSSSMLSQLVVSMMESSSSSSDGDMWKGRAISFVEALMKILVYMRDRGDILLDAHLVRQYFVLDKLETIVLDKKFPLPSGRLVSIAEIPEAVLDPMNTFVFTLPGYSKSRKHRQGNEVLEQFGFITMQLTRQFTSLADTYGHIIRTKLAEVDFRDVVLNRRILVVLLPALEKAPDELSMLGKVVVSSLKAMMASGLGERVEGTYQEMIDRKPTNAPSPYMCILDEYGYYAVEGFAVVPAQARSLGFSTIFAGQDLPAFQKASKEEAASIGANTNIKICMKLEDPTETWEFFQKTAGEAYVTHTSGFSNDAASITHAYNDTHNAQIERRARIDLLDLKDQRMGEMHIFFASRIVRARFYYANPPPVPRMKLNQFLKVDSPDDLFIEQLENRLTSFETKFDDETWEQTHYTLDKDIEYLLQQQKQFKKATPSRTEQFQKALIQLCHKEIKEDEKLFQPDEYDTPIMGRFDILTSPAQKPPMPTEDSWDPLTMAQAKNFHYSLLDKKSVCKNIRSIERFMGKSNKESNLVGQQIINKLRETTQYPPFEMQVPRANKEKALENIQTLLHYLKGRRVMKEKGQE